MISKYLFLFYILIAVPGILPSSAFLSPLPVITKNDGCQMQMQRSSKTDQSSRRDILVTSVASIASIASALPIYPPSAMAKLDPDQAYLNLRAAREELVVAGRKYFPKEDMDGLRAYLENEAVNMNNYETNAQTLLESKRLDAESKKEIGTIRRYGVGADVVIMYGGLKSEISEENDPINFREAEKYYVRTLDSLEEVISIVRSNKGFNNLGGK